MPDITMCRTEQDCPLKEKCYRYMAAADPYWQSYTKDFNYDEERHTCANFIQLCVREETRS